MWYFQGTDRVGEQQVRYSVSTSDLHQCLDFAKLEILPLVYMLLGFYPPREWADWS